MAKQTGKSGNNKGEGTTTTTKGNNQRKNYNSHSGSSTKGGGSSGGHVKSGNSGYGSSNSGTEFPSKGGSSYDDNYDNNNSFRSNNSKGAGYSGSNTNDGYSSKESSSYEDNYDSGDSFGSTDSKYASDTNDPYGYESPSKGGSSYDDDYGARTYDSGGSKNSGNYSNNDYERESRTGNSKYGGYDDNEPINDPPPYDDSNDEVVAKRPETDTNWNPEKGGGEDDQEADMVFTEEEVYGDSSATNSDQGGNENRNAPSGDVLGGREWNRRGTPNEGDTHMGHTIQMIELNGSRRPAIIINGRNYIITRYGRRRGIFYGGRADSTRRTIRNIATRHRTDNELFLEKAVLSYTVLGEGGFSSINTYDDQVFTLGTGLAGGRLNRYLQSLRGTPIGTVINEISYFRGLRFNGSQQIRLDINAIHQMVELFENPEYSNIVGSQSIRDYLNNSLKIGSSRNRSGIQSWIVENNVRPEVIGIAAYLNHGRPRFTPTPLNDVAKSVRIGGNNISAQVAVLLKLHAQRICLDSNPERVGGGPSGRQASAAVTRRLPNKVPHFQRAVRASGEQNFSFDYGTARTIIPCINPRRWRSSASRPSGVYLEHQHQYFSFGSRI